MIYLDSNNAAEMQTTGYSPDDISGNEEYSHKYTIQTKDFCRTQLTSTSHSEYPILASRDEKQQS